MAIRDLTGQKFGKLTAIQATDQRNKQGSVIWKCRCDCGNECFVPSDSLVRGNSQSCGCIRKEITKQHGKKVAEYASKTMYKEGTNLNLIEPGKLFKNNRSGHTGVSWNSRRNTYQAYINFQGKRKHLGYFKNYEDAVQAREEAEKELFSDIWEKYGKTIKK